MKWQKYEGENPAAGIKRKNGETQSLFPNNALIEA